MTAHHRHAVSVGFVSLGCAKNLVDAQVMAGTLLEEGLSLAPSPDEADVVVVNTCSFIQDARDESYGAIAAACRRKAEGGCRAVIVTGCLPQRYAAELPSQLPDVDAFVGVDALDRIASIIRRVVDSGTKATDVSARAIRLFEPRRPGLVFTGGPYAYIKIAEGCNHGCAFCAIPGIRGRHRSRPADAIVQEAEQILSRGFREVNLISQDTTAYGRDLGEGASLPQLLRSLGAVVQRSWIRILYGFPTGVDDRLLEAMADTPQVCHYLDVPIQHSHPEILRAMRRGGTAPAVRALPVRARAHMSDVALRTTCLVGFPGETEEHFRDLLDFVIESRFDHVGVFVFSPEQGTPAVDLPNRPPSEVAEERRARLMAAQQQVVAARHASLTGRADELLLEAPADKRGRAWTGRTRRLAPEVDGVVRVKRVPDDARPGDFLRIRYTGSLDYDMLATCLGRCDSPPKEHGRQSSGAVSPGG